MNLYSRLYRLGLVSLTLAIPLNIVLLADKTQSISAQPESQFQETLSLGGANTNQVLLTQREVTGGPNIHFPDIDAQPVSQQLTNQITPIASGTNYMIGIKEGDITNITHYSEVGDGDDLIAELTLETTSAIPLNDIPIILVTFEDKEVNYEFEVAIPSACRMIEAHSRIAVYVDTRQKRFYVAHDHTSPLGLYIVAPDIALNVETEELMTSGSYVEDFFLEQGQIAYFNYNTWRNNSDDSVQIHYSPANIIAQQSGPLDLGNSADVEYQARAVGLSPLTPIPRTDCDSANDLQSPK